MTSLQNGNYNTRSMNGLSSIYANDITCDEITAYNGTIQNNLNVGSTINSNSINTVNFSAVNFSTSNIFVSGSIDASGNIATYGNLTIYDKSTPTPRPYTFSTTGSTLKLNYNNGTSYDIFDVSRNPTTPELFLRRQTYSLENFYIDNLKYAIFGVYNGGSNQQALMRWNDTNKEFSIKAGAFPDPSTITLTARSASLDRFLTINSTQTKTNNDGVFGDGANTYDFTTNGQRTFNVVGSSSQMKLARSGTATTSTAPGFELETYLNSSPYTLTSRVAILGSVITGGVLDERFRFLARTGTDFDIAFFRRTGCRFNTAVDISGNVQITGNLGVSGSLSFPSLTLTGNLQVDGNYLPSASSGNMNVVCPISQSLGNGIYQVTSSSTVNNDFSASRISGNFGGVSTTPVLEVKENFSGREVLIVPNSAGGGYNGAVSINDTAIIASANTVETGKLFIGTWTANQTGIQMNNQFVNMHASNGYIEFYSPIRYQYSMTAFSFITSNLVNGYTNSVNAGVAFSGTASDTVNAVAQVGTISIPPGVWIINVHYSFTLNTSATTITQKRFCISETTASATPASAGGLWYTEQDDVSGASGLRDTRSMCITYHHLSATSRNLFLNAGANTSGSQTVTCSGNIKITRIA